MAAKLNEAKLKGFTVNAIVILIPL